MILGLFLRKLFELPSGWLSASMRSGRDRFTAMSASNGLELQGQCSVRTGDGTTDGTVCRLGPALIFAVRVCLLLLQNVAKLLAASNWFAVMVSNTVSERRRLLFTDVAIHASRRSRRVRSVDHERQLFLNVFGLLLRATGFLQRKSRAMVRAGSSATYHWVGGSFPSGDVRPGFQAAIAEYFGQLRLKDRPPTQQVRWVVASDSV